MVSIARQGSKFTLSMDHFFKLPYGIKDGELVTIDEVVSGLACGCICQCCGKPLVARKGNFLTHHFAHYKSADCSGGLQTALHLMSKEIINNYSTFTTPPLFFDDTRYEIIPEHQIPVFNVALEKRLGSMVPDLIIETKNEKKLLVEIIVTNKPDHEKIKKIRELNIAAVGVYVAALIQFLFERRNFRLTDDLFRKELTEGTNYKYWIHNPKVEAVKRYLKDNYAKKKILKNLNLDFSWFDFVDHCPLQKRTWEGGFSKGKSYAKLEDCSRCVYDVSMPESTAKPDCIYCIGHLKQNLNQVVAQIMEHIK
jgi:hypothetical protein